jgi:CRISPR-associated endonuclease/helicase Cas3
LLRILGSEPEPREVVERLIENAVLPREGPTMMSLGRISTQILEGRRADLRLIMRAPYRRNEADRSTGFLIVAPRGLPILRERRRGLMELEAITENDERSAIGSGRCALAEHSDDVESGARETATQLRLSPSFIDDVAMAGWFHDAGKADSRFQHYLLGSGWLREGELLAKSIEPRDRQADRRARSVSALPDSWRHEALSVRMARTHQRFEKANDPELVLWLIGVHHGWGRPLFPHDDPLDGNAREIAFLNGRLRLGNDRAPHSPEFGFDVVDSGGIVEVSWPALGRRLSSRYGAWTVALFEAIVRLADHRASAARNRVSVR